MYEVNQTGAGGGAGGAGGFGAGPIVAGSVLLPATGGNRVLTAIAVTSITVGVVIVVSTLIRAAAKRAQ